MGVEAWLAVFVVAFLVGGCAEGGIGSLAGKDSVEMFFFINETGQPLDGSVSLNGQFLGNTTNGVVVAKKAGLEAGELSVNGRDGSSGGNFTFRFEFSSSDAKFGMIRFQVPLADYSQEIYDAARADAESVEKEIFQMANVERERIGVKPLRWNGRIAAVARDYAKALPVEGFHHMDTSGRGVKQRLSDAGIFFVVANENLYYSGSMTAQIDLAKASIDGWLGSPGHRATLLDRDNLYSDAGVGVHCERKDCYVVMNFAALRQEQKVSLKKGWVTFQYLHNPDYGFAEENVPLHLELASSAPVNVYVVADHGEYDKFVAGKRPDASATFEKVASIDEGLVAPRGEGMIIEAAEGDASVSFSIDFS